MSIKKTLFLMGLLVLPASGCQQFDAPGGSRTSSVTPGRVPRAPGARGTDAGSAREGVAVVGSAGRARPTG